MANYKHAKFLHLSRHDAFDHVFGPGAPAPHSGIYRCEGCGVNEVATIGNPLPAQDHHPHRFSHGDIGWRLIVATR